MAEPQERRRHAAHDGAGLGARVASVENVAHDLVARADEREGPRRRHAEVVHRLAAQKLADARPHHGAAVGRARVRRRPRALELELPARSVRRCELAERHRAAVAELACPMAKLVTAITARIGRHAVEQGIAREDLRAELRAECVGIDPEQPGDLGTRGDDVRPVGGRGRDARVDDSADLPSRARRGRIAGQGVEEAALEGERLERAERGIVRERGVHGRPRAGH